MVAAPAPRVTVEEAACARLIWVEVTAAVEAAVIEVEAADTGASKSGATPQSLLTQC
jgi:hypothetical protein